MLASTEWFPMYGRKPQLNRRQFFHVVKTRTHRKSYGGHSERETPGPIPNPEAKPLSADGTAGGTLWESRTPPDTHSRNGHPSQGGHSALRSPTNPVGIRESWGFCHV